MAAFAHTILSKYPALSSAIGALVSYLIILVSLFFKSVKLYTCMCWKNNINLGGESVL